MIPRPLLLRPDNFTPRQRTPWGGHRIAGTFKAGLALPAHDGVAPVGESWELSATPEFPSECMGGGSLVDALAANPRAWLGAEAALGRTRTALLVKWLDAAEDLSLQIHPEDDYAALAADESGKPECWYVVAHDPGAGLYLGFAPGTDAARVRALLERGDDLSAHMVFREVELGDVVVVEPGMPHAIGRGVTLIEPQVVRPGKRGVTYRYWDWNRRYDAAGKPDPGGTPRKLDLEHALAVTDWARATDQDVLSRSASPMGWPDASRRAHCELLCGPEDAAPVRSRRLRMARLIGTGLTVLPDWNTLRSLTVIEGQVALCAGSFELVVNAGCTAAVPAQSGAMTARLSSAHAVISGVGA